MTEASPRGDTGPDPAAEVLLALAVCGPLAAARAADAIGSTEASVAEQIEGLLAAGRVARTAAEGDLISLTEAGREAAAEVVRREGAALGAQLAAVHGRFAALDRALKEAITRWQVRTVGGVEVPNDHRDRAHDGAVLADIGDLGERAVAWLEPLARRRSRYRRYRDRLAAALARIAAGEVGWIAGLGVDSLHTIWWQLHGDLLAILGRTRGSSEA